MDASVRILSGGAAHALVRALEPGSGLRIEGRFGAVGAMRDRLLAGEACDVLVLTQEMVRDLAAAGLADADSARPIGVARTALAVRSGHATAAVPDAAGLERLLVSATELYFPDPAKATAGRHFMKVLDALGLAHSHRARFRSFESGAATMQALARDGAAQAVGCTHVTEILPVAGLRLLGPLPAPFGLATTYTAAICTRAESRQRAAALVELLCSADAAPVRARCGFEP